MVIIISRVVRIAIFCMFSFIGQAIGAGDQGVINNQLVSLPIIQDRDKKLTVLKIDPVVIDILKRFNSSHIDLELIDDLNQHSNLFFNHVELRLNDEKLTVSEIKDLMIILSVMKSDKAIVSLIALAEYYQNNTEVTQKTLLLLRDMAVTKPVLAYMDKLFKASRNNIPLIRSVLLYYMAVKHPSGMRWASYYRSPGIDSQLRFAGMSLSAILSDDDQVTRWILAELKRKPVVPAYQQYYLLQGLYSSITRKEFDYLIARLNLSPIVVKEFQRIQDFNGSKGEAKNNVASFMLTSPYLDQQNIALKYFILEQEISDVWVNLGVGKRLSAVRIANVLNMPIDSNKKIVKAEAETPLFMKLTQETVVYLIAIVFVLFLLWLGYRYIIRDIDKFKSA